jgi:hypothetical protein
MKDSEKTVYTSMVSVRLTDGMRHLIEAECRRRGNMPVASFFRYAALSTIGRQQGQENTISTESQRPGVTFNYQLRDFQRNTMSSVM